MALVRLFYGESDRGKKLHAVVSKDSGIWGTALCGAEVFIYGQDFDATNALHSFRHCTTCVKKATAVDQDDDNL